ncbi:MAG: hypothetical protein CM1200mP10_17110 [Candidatus Neomarinimicrobiota bacterium]|nr:MAG: hypothetical protein CM1200mP10_17110 [Candidatus Neomarinimicrobiota bacterium]
MQKIEEKQEQDVIIQEDDIETIKDDLMGKRRNRCDARKAREKTQMKKFSMLLVRPLVFPLPCSRR